MTEKDGSPIPLPRSSGTLLHISSLPGRFGIGDFGPNAYQFADFLAETGQRIWQFLPLVPTGYGNSPYSSPSTFAVNPLFISPTLLHREGLLERAPESPELPDDRVDFEGVTTYKYEILETAYDRFTAGRSTIDPESFTRFEAENEDWLDDFALFTALKHAYDERAWTDWPARFARREPAAMTEARAAFASEIRRHKFYQFLCFRQWSQLKRYCNERSIYLFGDLPIYVAHDSADVWGHPEFFHLDEHGHSTVVAGVPPDYFSKTGQRWGNPLYRWDAMEEGGFAWWTRRFAHTFQLADFVRLDHFRAFAGYWEIPASEETAIHGRWVKAPGSALFRALEKKLGPLPLVAEDLGMITPDVTELMEEFGFPGMAVLQFAFGGDAHHAFLPHNYRPNLVAYTGTHDNDTIAGWWKELQEDETQARATNFVRTYLEVDDRPGRAIHEASIRAVAASTANFVVFPLQDLMGLDASSRMNTPGRSHGNWTWRFDWKQLDGGLEDRLKTLTALYGRSDMLDIAIARREHPLQGDPDPGGQAAGSRRCDSHEWKK